MEGIQYGIQQGYNPMTTAAYGSQPYGAQFGQQLPFGSANPLSGLIGSGIGGLMSAQNIGRQTGHVIDGVGGNFQSYGSPYGATYGNIDPLTAAHVQQAQLMQTQLAQQAQLAQQVQQAQLAQLAQQQFGRSSPFGIDPISAAIAQQRGLLGQQAHLAPWLGVNASNRIDPLMAAYVQQAQIAQLCQQLALQGPLEQQVQFGQPGPFGHQAGYGPFGQGPLGQHWLGGGQNVWANPQFGRTVPLQYGYGGQVPAC